MLSTVIIAAPVWFPQWMSENPATGDIYWDTTHLENIKFNNVTCFINYDPDSNTSTPPHCYNNGCYVNSIAMLLRNTPNVKTTRGTFFDIREATSIYSINTLTSKEFLPDPYIVALALNNDRITIDGKTNFSLQGSYLIDDDSLSVYVYRDRIANDFPLIDEYNGSATIEYLNESDYTDLQEDELLILQYNILYDSLNTALNLHPNGVILKATDTVSHMMYVKKINGAIRVFDPGRNNNSIISNYYNVPLYSYFVTMKVRNITEYEQIRYFTYEENK